MPFRVRRSVSSRAAVLAAIAVHALLVPAAPAAAAEIALAGEPFTIAERPEAVGAPGVTWLPHAGAERPAGFFLLWGEGAEEEQRSLVRSFVPEGAATAAAPPAVVAGPADRSGIRVAAGVDGRVAVAFEGDRPEVPTGGVLLAPSLAVDADFELPLPEAGLPESLDAALLSNGRVVVVREVQTGLAFAHLEAHLFAPDGTPIGPPVAIGRFIGLLRVREVVAAPGGFLVFFASLTQNRFTSPLGPSTLLVQRFDLDGQPLAPPVGVHEALDFIAELSVARASGGWMAAWREEVPVFEDGQFVGLVPRFSGRRLRIGGEAAGPVQPLLADLEPEVHSVLLQPAPGDSALLVWSQGDDGGVDVRASLLGADLAPAGETVTLANHGVGVATSPAGEGLLAWREADGTIVGQRFAITAECVPSDTVLCLQDGRFEVSVDWADFQGGAGPGRRVPVASRDSGLFWFFHPDNWEMLVKVLDACPVNGHFWVFSAAATNVEYALTVNDLVARETRVFRNVLGDTARALTATDAFPTCGTPPDSAAP